MHLNKIVGLALACLLTAGTVAACSSKKNTTVDAAAAKTTTTTAAPSSGSSRGSSGSTGGSSGDTSGGSGSGAGALSATQCLSAGTAYDRVLAGAQAAVTGNTTGVSELQSEYDALGASIPSGMKDDYQTVANAYAQFAKDIKGVSFTDPSALAQLQKAEKDLSSPEVKAASENISHYFSNHCRS